MSSRGKRIGSYCTRPRIYTVDYGINRNKDKRGLQPRSTHKNNRNGECTWIMRIGALRTLAQPPENPTFYSLPMAIYSILDSQVVIIAFKVVFLDLYIERSKLFFSGLWPGLTNQVPVRDSVSRTPLSVGSYYIIISHLLKYISPTIGWISYNLKTGNGKEAAHQVCRRRWQYGRR